MKNKVQMLALGLAVIPPLAHAAGPTLGDVLSNSGIAVSGFIDGSASYLSGTGAFTSTTSDRVFDTTHDGFTLNNADLLMKSTATSGMGGLVELNAGSDAAVFASAPYNVTSHQMDVQQAYMSYIGGPLTIEAGKFDTLAGAEVIDSPSDVNFSRSILFGYAIPFTHTGVRSIYTLDANTSTTVTVGLNNGWDTMTAPVAQKTVELGVASTPVKPLALTASYYGGDAVPVGTSVGYRQLFDAVATYTVTTPLSLIVNYDHGSQDNYNGLGAKATWSGVAGYVVYQFNPTWRLAARAEYFKDPQGYRTGVAQNWKEGTLTLAYLPTASVELRGEVREDKSNVASFKQTSGASSDTQHSVAVEALYKF